MNIRMINILIIFFAVCCSMSSNSKQSKAMVTNVKLNDHLFSIDVAVHKGLTFQNIYLKKDPLGNNWILKIKPSKGLTKISKAGVPQSSINQLYFIELMAAVIPYIHDSGLGSIDRIQLDFQLVAPIWSNIIEVVKSDIKDKRGNVEIKNPQMSKSIKVFLDTSEEINSFCKSIIEFQYKCQSSAISLNPVAFDRNNLGKSWKSLLSKDDLGLNKNMWFSIKIVEE